MQDQPNYMFTSESVSEGHPDKIADQISDAVLDLYLSKDPLARVACETLVTTNRIVLAGEVKTRPDVVIKADEVAHAAIGVAEKIGYDQLGFSFRNLALDNHLHRQSEDIAQGVDRDGAGDQGIMFGFACDETEELMPAAIHYSHRLLESLADARHQGRAYLLGPDAKSQLTLIFEDGRPIGCDTVLVSHQHKAEATQDEVREIVREHALKVLPDGWMCEEDKFYINPTGKFEIGGPHGDAGLTGRKIIVDTYGGAACHGGGAFSGKDPTKVDRSAAYAARYLAKNVVAAGLAKRCTIQLSYAIGVAKPLSIFVDFHGTGSVDPSKTGQILMEVMDLSPKGIRETLGLNKPIYQPTAAYGHFGRKPTQDGGFSWERLDLVAQLKSSF
ncbi:MAG: methionine adenosyltransferase [SAR116 cluster bacterium]|nr:methionine adenosyltransferase [Paracoccaceae bacterium]RCL79834.1 MAG: methionine adenosyltransferase [SAR116 cluster bacterium]HBQ23416.1 methionine adenosyltransferase [Alphaproteobacteria bacterium]